MSDNGMCCICLNDVGFFTLDTRMKTLSLQEMVEFSIGLIVWALFVIFSGAHLSGPFT